MIHLAKTDNWIRGVLGNPKGSLHKSLGIPQDQKIPAGTLAAAAKRGGKVGRQAKLAQTLAKLRKGKKK